MAQVLAFGDSITYGSWDPENSGWANLLRKYFDDKVEKEQDFYGLVYNLGIPGETTEGLVKRFKSETEVRFRKGEEDIFLFAFGANDSALIMSKGAFKVSVEDYVRNLDTVLGDAKSYSTKIALLNTTPVVEKVTAHVENKDKSRLNEYVGRYNAPLQTLAEKHNVPLLDVYSAFMQHDLEGLFCEDGLHPNEVGHEIIFEIVKQQIEPWL